jgi:hypothetical protein
MKPWTRPKLVSAKLTHEECRQAAETAAALIALNRNADTTNASQAQ